MDIIKDKINEHEVKISRLEGETSRIVADIKDLKSDRKQFVEILKKVEDALTTLAHTVEKLDIRLQCEEDYTKENKQSKKNVSDKLKNALLDGGIKAIFFILMLGLVSWIVGLPSLAELFR
ncbi:MAG: hypothetical protein KMY55_09920 [Dethiosulfatibacter sp.]|nr:hypothetical protein [Dethiosulfatibacter sp.]